MRLLESECQAILVDVQERLFPHINQSEELLDKLSLLLQGLRNLEIPLIVSEQYKKGLGETIRAIKPWVENQKHIEKTSFSCLDEPEIKQEIESRNRKQILVFGIETHVCVMQTCIDLKEQGFDVYVVADACSSRSEIDKEYAIKRLATEGIFITSVESVLFEICRFSGTDRFKIISKLVR